MYNLYRRIGEKSPELLLTTDKQSDLKNNLIMYLKKDGFSETQIMFLIEFGVPIKWRNGKFIELKREESATILQTEDGQLSYTILE